MQGNILSSVNLIQYTTLPSFWKKLRQVKYILTFLVHIDFSNVDNCGRVEFLLRIFLKFSGILWWVQ